MQPPLPPPSTTTISFSSSFFFLWNYDQHTQSNYNLSCMQRDLLPRRCSINQSINQSINLWFQFWCTATKLFEFLMLFHALFNADPSLVLHMKMKLIYACSKSLESSSSFSSSSPSCKSVFFFLNSIFFQCTCSLCKLCIHFFILRNSRSKFFKVYTTQMLLFQSSNFLMCIKNVCFRVQVFFLIKRCTKNVVSKSKFFKVWQKCSTSKYFFAFLKKLFIDLCFYCQHECQVDNIDISKYIEL
jgi:hypothetical protein